MRETKCMCDMCNPSLITELAMGVVLGVIFAASVIYLIKGFIPDDKE